MGPSHGILRCNDRDGIVEVIEIKEVDVENILKINDSFLWE